MVRSVAEAKSHLSECLRSAESGEPVVITRRGKPIAALVAIEDFAQLERLRKAGPQAGLAGLAGGWDDSQALVDEILSTPRRGSRQGPDLDGSCTEAIMAFLFDTDAISEVLKPRPAPSFLRWLSSLDRSLQFTSAVVVGELFKGASRSKARARHLKNIETRVLPAVTVLSYDVAVARHFGRIRAALESRGQILADADLQIAATAIEHGLELVTGNLRHFSRVPGLRVNTTFADSRRT